MITVLHGGEGYAQMITILHRGDYVICSRPLFCLIRVINRSTGRPKKVFKQNDAGAQNSNQN